MPRNMPVRVRSFAKINLGLAIGKLRADRFHELRTIYQTLALHDTVLVTVVRGSGIEIGCSHPKVPCDQSNTCYRMAWRLMEALRAKGRVMIEIEKRLPVEGGLGGASSNAIATLLALERALDRELAPAEKLRLAADVGSDLPLFLVGGTTLGVGRGEQVYPLPDLPSVACVVAVPQVGISTPQAFAAWDRKLAGTLAPSPAPVPARGQPKAEGARKSATGAAKLTPGDPSDKMEEFGRAICAGLSGLSRNSGRPSSGVPAAGRGRAETPLLDLVRTGIENDFEQVVFSQHPELGEVKRQLERAGAWYASLSGSGSALYGLFQSRSAAEKAAAGLAERTGVPALVTATLGRYQYWQTIFD